MKTDIFQFLLVFIVKFHTSAAVIAKGKACTTEGQDTQATQCATNYKCIIGTLKCLKELKLPEDDCAEEHTVCIGDLVCQAGKCLIKHGRANTGSGNCVGETLDSATDEAKCVAHSKCDGSNNCKCKTAFPVNAATGICKISLNEKGCTVNEDCLGENVECKNQNCKSVSGARGLCPSYSLLVVCSIFTSLVTRIVL